MPRPRLIACLVVALGLLHGCKSEEKISPIAKDYGRPLPPGELALRKIRPENYPNFREAFSQSADLQRAAEYSLDYLSRPSSQHYFPYGDITHDRAVQSLKEFINVVHSAGSADEFDSTIRQRFDVYQSVGWDGSGTVYFTGYYTPIFEGRKQPDERFCFPLYRRPPDLVSDPEGKTLGKKLPDGRIIPFATRREIEQQQLLRGLEIAWLKDPFEAYVVSVQGSGKLRLADGTLWELGYAGNNGYDYRPIAGAMIADGIMKRDEVSLQAMLRHFGAHPEDIAKYTQRNDRFIFFKETSGGPYGSINVPVTPGRSIATDKQVFPRACLAMVVTTLPAGTESRIQMQPFAAFVLDQDTGGAIRAAGRSDLYFGVGPQAEAMAGRTGSEGQLYYLFVKDGGGMRGQRAGS